ncbi:sterol transporter cytoplasmic membrane protein BstA [Methylomonas sp. MgM2]
MKINHYAAKIAEYFARNPYWVLGVALMLSIMAAWSSAQLPLYTSRQALLPQNAEVTLRLNNFLKNFGAASDLVLVLEGVPYRELADFADNLAAKLQAEPEIGRATSHLDMAFFLKYAYLLMPPDTLEKLATMTNHSPLSTGSLEQQLRRALDWSNSTSLETTEIDLQTADVALSLTAGFLAEWQRWLNLETPPTDLDWRQLLANTGVKGMTDGYFASHDGRMLFLFVHPKNSSGDFEHLGPFVDKVKQISASLTEQAEAAGLTPPTIGLSGLPAIEYEEYVNVRKDINLITFTSAGLVAALVLIVVRSLRWAALIFIPMGLGVLWSLGLALVTVGHLTIITAAFIAILFGLGADYGIFTSSRIAEERRAGKPLVEAIGAGIGSSFFALLTAGAASLLIFGTLASVDFPGFSELGVIATTGVLTILISTWTVQPALYALLPPKLEARTPPDKSHTAKSQPKRSGYFPLPLAITIVALALGFAVFGVVKGYAIPFDYDLLAMLPKDSQAAYYQRRMVAESDYQSEVIIFPAKNMAEAKRIVDETSKVNTISQVQSPISFFPEDATERLHRATNIAESFAKTNVRDHIADLVRDRLSEKSYELLQATLKNSLTKIDNAEEQAFSAGHANLVEHMEKVRAQLLKISADLAENPESGKTRSESFLRALLSEADAGVQIIDTWRRNQPLTPEQFPPSLRDRFFGNDGSIAVYAFPAKTVYDPANLDALMDDVYNISADATGFPTTHQVFSKTVVNSFTHGTQLALALTLVWLMIATRNVRRFALAALPLLIGGGWMLGLMALADIPYNFANIVALPLVLALAVDYGVWFSYRWSEMKTESPMQVSLAVSKAIGLAAGTSLAGLGAISLASYRGVSSMGITITIGLLCCLIATFFVAPAIGQLIDIKRQS